MWAKGGFPEFLSEVFKNVLWALLYLRWIAIMSYCVSQGTLLSYMTARMGVVSPEPGYIVTYN